MQKAESIFEQAHQFLNEQKQFLLAQWESLKTAAEKQQQEHNNKLLEKISCLDSLIIEVEGRRRRPTAEFLQVRTCICIVCGVCIEGPAVQRTTARSFAQFQAIHIDIATCGETRGFCLVRLGLLHL